MKKYLVITIFLMSHLSSGNKRGIDLSAEGQCARFAIELIDYFEKELKINFYGKIPKFVFDTFDHANSFARYYAKSNTVRINRSTRECAEHLYPGADSIVWQWYGRCLIGEFRGIIAHELGHFYTDVLAEAVGIADPWLFAGDTASHAKILGAHILREGIAEYFERTYTKQLAYPYFKENVWYNRFYATDTSFNTTSYLGYVGGYAVVKEILKKNVQKGVAYILQHPLNIPPEPEKRKDLSAVLRYRQQAIATLKR